VIFMVSPVESVGKNWTINMIEPNAATPRIAMRAMTWALFAELMPHLR